MPHAETHTVILPHAVAYNAKGAKNAIKIVARALAVDNAAQGLYDMAKNLGIPTHSPSHKPSSSTLLPCCPPTSFPLLLFPSCLIAPSTSFPAFSPPPASCGPLTSLVHPY